MNQTELNNLCTIMALSPDGRLLHLEKEIFSHKRSTDLYLKKLMKFYRLSLSNDYDRGFSIYFISAQALHCCWPEAERWIVNDTLYAYWYITDVMRKRWPEAEHAMRKNAGIWQNYCDRFKIQDTTNSNNAT